MTNDERPNTLTLKAIRINLGWSLEQASKRLGISEVTLASYERGDTYPNVPIIKRMERVYNIRILTDTVNFLLNNDALSDKNENEEV